MTVWLLSTCALIAALILLRRVLRGRIDPRLVYALWLLAAVRILVPGSLFPAPVSVSCLAEGTGVAQAVEDARYTTQTEETYGSKDPGQAGVEDIRGLEDMDWVQRESWLGSQDITDVEVVGAQEVPAEEAGGDPDSGSTYVRLELEVTRDRFAPLRYVWYAGMALVAAWFLFVNLRFSRRLRKGGVPYTDALPVPCPLPVYVVDGLSTPCLAGLLRPAVYLNQAALASGHLDHVLTHELTHYRHRDHWWAVVRCACLAVQWFDPLVWVAAHLSRQDCESACDASAIKRLGEGERLNYGHTLVNMIAAGRHPAALFQTATTMTGSLTSIRYRVTLIAKKPRMTALTLAAALVVAIVAAGCAFGGAGDQADSLPQEWYGDYVVDGEDDSVVGPINISYRPTSGSVGTITISADVCASQKENGDFDPAAQDPGYQAVELDLSAYGDGDVYYPALDDFFGAYESIQVYEVANAACPTQLLVLDGELWIVLNAQENGAFFCRLAEGDETFDFSQLYEALMAAGSTDEDCQRFLDLVLNDRFAANQFAQLLGWDSWETSGQALMERLTPYLASLKDAVTLTNLMALMDDYGKLSFSGAFAQTYLQAYGDQELSDFNEWANLPGNNGFLCSLYANPEQVDLKEAFYIGYGSDATRDTDPTPRYRLTAGEINEILQLRLGVTYSEDWLIVNFPWEYDYEEEAFYHMHGDTNIRFVFCYAMSEEDGVSTAYCYVQELGLTTVRMERAEDGGYRFLSHMLTGEDGGITPAQQAQEALDAIVGWGDELLDYYLEVDDGGEVTRLSVARDNSYMGHLNYRGDLMLDLNWQTSFVGQSPSGISVTVGSAGGDSWIQCWENSDLVLLHRDGEDSWMTATVQSETQNTLYRSLMWAADDAITAQIYDTTVDGSVADYQQVLDQYMEQVAAAWRAAPDWVISKPEDAQPGDCQVSSAYWGEYETIEASTQLYIQIDPMEASTMNWQAGSGLGEIASGPYTTADGYYVHYMGYNFARNEAGDWCCTGGGTGGFSLDFPTPLEEATVEQLVDYFYHTSGFAHAYSIPLELCKRSLSELSAALDGADDPQKLCAALGHFFWEYSWPDEGLTYEVLLDGLDDQYAAWMEASYEGESLSRAELDELDQWLGQSGNCEMFWYGADDMDEADLALLLHDGADVGDVEQDLPQEDKDLLAQIGVDADAHLSDGVAVKVTGAQIKDYAWRRLRLELTDQDLQERMVEWPKPENWSLLEWYYTPQNDTFYHFGNGTSRIDVKCLSGVRHDNGALILTVETKHSGGPQYVATLTPYGDSYRFVSVVPAS